MKPGTRPTMTAHRASVTESTARALAHTLAAIALGLAILAVLALTPTVLLLWALGSGS